MASANIRGSVSHGPFHGPYRPQYAPVARPATGSADCVPPCGGTPQEEEWMSVNLQPLEDRIVVKPGEGEEKTASGLVIPDTAKEKPQEGEVIAVGPGRFEDGNRVPLDVKVGDTVIYSKYGGTEVKLSGEDYLILSARDVLAIVTK
jgi:chaperonin GroES